jgi:hypothetical protein
MTYNEAIEIMPSTIGRTPSVHHNVVYAITQKGSVFICSLEDFDLIKDHKINEDAGGYIRFGHNNRLLKLLVERLQPKGGFLDHEDRNKLNYLRENLRPATHQQNVWNQKHHTKSQFIGVKPVSNFKKCPRYQAFISFNNKRISVGTFKTEKEAAHARDRAAVCYHHRYAVLNFPCDYELYATELALGTPAVQKLYDPGVITHPMKYISKATHSRRWLVQFKTGTVAGRFSSIGDAQTFRDKYLQDHPFLFL